MKVQGVVNETPAVGADATVITARRNRRSDPGR